MNFLSFFIFCEMISLIAISVESQRTMMDIFVPLRRYFLRRYTNLHNEIDKNYSYGKTAGLFQNEISPSAEFFCNTKNGPGRRSSVRPESIHKLRPGDIDIVAAMGDSLTVGIGIGSTVWTGIPIEYRALSWSIGGKNTWRKFFTLPNILKEFNPDLYGYATDDTISADRASKFNVAEGGAMSKDMPYQAKILYQRLKHDPKVDMKNHWKMLTIFIGANDFCSEMCYYKDKQKAISKHEIDMLKTLRFLRDHIPRLMVNIVTAVNTSKMLDLNNKPMVCHYANFIECPCFHGVKPKGDIESSIKIISEWIRKDDEIAALNEFHTNEFTVNVQPFSKTIHLPEYKNGDTNYHYFASDCFHFSQKLHALIAIALWNNLIQPEGNKTTVFHVDNHEFLCPTNERPFIATRENSMTTTN